jgi:hypothetical protein
MSLEQPVPQLRPMNLSDILDAVFLLYRNNFLTFIGVIALAQIPMFILQGFVILAFGQAYMNDILLWQDILERFNPALQTPSDLLAELPTTSIVLFFVFLMLLGLLQNIIIWPLMLGALSNAVAHRYLQQPVSILGAYNFGMGRIGTLIIAQFIVGLITGLVLLIAYLLAIGAIVFLGMSLASQIESNPMAIFGLVLFGVFVMLLVVVPIAVFLLIRFLFVPQVVVLEGQGIFSAIGRSWRLVSGSFWRTLGTAFVLWIMVTTIGFLVGLSFNLIDALITNFVVSQMILTFLTYAVNILTTPLYLVGLTLLYYDLRIRKEGYDMELMMQQTTSINQ